MNLVSSKVLKSTRQVLSRSSPQTTQAYSCELFIDSFKVSHRGFVYFIWQTNATQINSLRYQSKGKLVPVKETLTVSIRISSKNGKQQPFNSFIKLMAETGQELDQYELYLNDLSSHFKDIEMPMDRGLCIVKIRRKQLNIGIQADTSHQRSLYRSRNVRLEDNKSSVSGIGGEYQSLQQELGRVKKELQDQVYLNNKLRNDRDVLMVTKQELQIEIETMIVQTTKEFKMLREHYDNRISIREHSYQEQIQNLVNMVNSDSAHSKKVVDLLMKQKIKCQDELVKLTQIMKTHEIEIKTREEKIVFLEGSLAEHQQNLSKLQSSLEEKTKEFDQFVLEHDTLKNQHEQRITTLEEQLGHCNEQLEKQEHQLTSLRQRTQELQLQVQNKDAQLATLQQTLKASKEREDNYIKEHELMQKQNQILEEEKRAMIDHVDTLRQKLEQSEYQMEFNENVIAQLKKQQSQKEEELYQQLENLEKIYQKKIEDLLSNYQQEKNKNQNSSEVAHKEKIELESRVIDLQNLADGSELKIKQLNNEISDLQSQVESNKIQAVEKNKRMGDMEAQIKKLKEQNASLNEPLMIKGNSNPSSPRDRQKSIGKGSPQDFNNKIKQLQARIADLEAELKTAKTEAEKKDNEMRDLKDELNKFYEGDIILSQTKKLNFSGVREEKEHSDHLSGVKGGQKKNEEGEEFHMLLSKKEDQIQVLRRKIDDLQNLYLYLQQRLDKIIEMYPNVDLEKIDAQIPVVERCDSEQEEEKEINKTISRPNSPKPGDQVTEFLHEPISGTNSSKGKPVYIPRSETRIRDEPEKKYPPRETHSIKKKVSIAGSVKENLSEKSGASYIKVSHSQKIRDLEKGTREMEERQRAYLRQIQRYKHQLQQLEDKLIKYELSQKPLSPTFRPGLDIPKVNTESQVLIQDQRVKNLVEDCKEKQLELNKKDSKITELEGQLKLVNQNKMQQSNKIILLEQKLTDFQKQFDKLDKQWAKKVELLTDANKQLQKQMAELEEKLRKEKENAQEARLSLKELTLHYDSVQAELKKLRSQNEALEEKVHKLAGTELVIRELSKQIEDMGKKGLEQTRTLNHLKLEKDASDQELRLAKKRQNDQARIASQWQEKASSLQRVIEQFKRKQSKLKRQIEDGHEEVRRSKLQQKKLQDELQALSTAQIGWQVERRKYLDEISSLQDQLSRKDYDLAKLNKQIQRWRVKAQERDDVRLGKKSQLREEIERLENQMIRKDKKLFQETEENKLLRGRLELVERQNKRIMEQKNQSYGQKLRYYVEEMSSIKKLLQQYQNQNSRLKIDNNQLYQQYEMLRSNSDKLHLRYEEGMTRQEDIMTDLQAYMDENNMLKEKIGQTQREITQLELSFGNLRKECDEQKNRGKKIGQKLENSERDLENAQNEMRDLKLKLSEYETNYEINGKISEKYKLLQRKKTQLEEDWKRLKTENETLKGTYTFTRQDLEKAVAEVRGQQRRMREQEVHRIEEECNKAISSKTQRLQQELLEVYNQNNKIRTDLQVLHQQTGRQKGRIIELQTLCQKVNSLQGQNQYLKNEISLLNEELKKKNQKLNKTEITIQGMESQYNLKQTQLNGLRIRIKDLEVAIDKLNEQIKARKNAQKDLQEALIRSSDQKGKQKNEIQLVYKQRQMDLIRQFQSKISGLEGDLQKAKDRQAKLLQENSQKMKKLQEKMDEMEEALKQKQKAIEGHYQAQVHDLENSLIKLSDELKEKLSLIDELNEAIIVLEGDNVDLSKQLQEMSYKHEEERSLLQNQLNKLKIKFKETQAAYSANLKSLEDEMMRANQVKVNNTASSRVKTAQAEDRVSKRFEDKLKGKDKKIEQLKENIYTLEETILKLKKKQTIYEATLTQLQKMKMTLSNYEKEKKKTQLEWEAELAKHAELVRELKKEILRLKESEQHARLTCQEKLLENQGLLSELKTVKQLYQELQRQLERRKNNLTLQLEEETSLQYQLRMQESKIAELQQRILGYIKTIKDLELEDKKKNNELKKTTELLEQMRKSEQQYKVEIQKLTKEVNMFKQELSDMNTSCDSVKSELKLSRTEITRLKKVHEDLRQSNQSKQLQSKELKKINEQLMTRYKDYEQTARRYSLLNQRSRDELGCSIQQLIQRYSVIVQQKDAQINMLVEQIEELKFLNERKYMDYDEMKKMNFELQLKVEEYDNLADQLETLRKICDKLEQQKKNAVFKDEVLRMQIQNLAGSAPPDMKQKIQSILSTPIVPSYANFSFY